MTLRDRCEALVREWRGCFFEYVADLALGVTSDEVDAIRRSANELQAALDATEGEVWELERCEVSRGSEPAFPDGSTNEWGNANHGGMTLREHYAGLAMQGFITLGRCIDAEVVARDAVRFTDALLSGLEKRR